MGQLYDFDLLCIGSGPAGQRAAVQAAKLGKRSAVVEKGRVVGGVCIGTGTIPSKMFREAVLSFSIRSSSHGSRPTAEQLLSRVAEVVRLESEVIANQLWRNDVELLRGTASFVDPYTVAVKLPDNQVRTVTAANILIACGTRPAPPPDVPPNGETVITSDDISNLKRLPRAMVVVGAGVIGVEYASMFAELGVAVTLVEKRDRLLEFLDGEIVDELMHQMRDRNVIFRMQEAVAGIEITDGSPRRVVVLLDSGKRIASDLVLFCAGRLAVTDQLNLPAAGLTADDRGRLKVDASFRTSVPHIFAAGDVIGYPSLAATSAEQGRLAANNAFGIPVGPMPDHFPIGIYAIPEVSMVGATESELTQSKTPYETGVARYREIARGQILGDDSGLLKLIFDRNDKRLLGIHAIGTGATELIHIGQAVLALGGGLEYFLRTVFNYPTLAECYKVAALNAANKLSA